MAKRVKEILTTESSYKSTNTEDIIESIQKEHEIQYDEVQIAAIKTAVRSKFMVLTGGPGTGKTTTTLAIIKIFQKLNANDIQVLCPMQRGETGAFNLNTVLQETLNPNDVSVKYGGTVFRLKDKVMQIKNNYDKNVFNGDIGSITSIDTEDKTLVISFDGVDVEYDATELDEVVLAYATTVHKSQGSEYKIVIAPFTMQHYMMLQRNLLYTCVTRAKKILVLVGSKKAIGIAVSNNNTQKRNTMLASRLRNGDEVNEKRRASFKCDRVEKHIKEADKRVFD